MARKYTRLRKTVSAAAATTYQPDDTWLIKAGGGPHRTSLGSKAVPSTSGSVRGDGNSESRGRFATAPARQPSSFVTKLPKR